MGSLCRGLYLIDQDMRIRIQAYYSQTQKKLKLAIETCICDQWANYCMKMATTMYYFGRFNTQFCCILLVLTSQIVMRCFFFWFVYKIQLSVLEHFFLFTIFNSLWETIKTSTGSAAIKMFCLFPVLFCSKFVANFTLARNVNYVTEWGQCVRKRAWSLW